MASLPPTSKPTVPPTAAPRTAPASAPKFGVSRGPARTAWKLGIYGPEGVGKSTLVSMCPGVIVADLEHSTIDLDVCRVTGILPPIDTVQRGDLVAQYAAAWANLRAWVQSLTSGIVAIDSITRAEDWCAAWVVRNKKSNDGQNAADSLEDFKYKAGLTFVTDEFRRLLGDIDNAYARGVSVVMVAHNRVAKFKNPDGSDYVRNEPRLVDDPKGSNMLQWVQFLDHLVFLDRDVNANKGKASGGASRTMYFDGSPNRLSKARGIATDPVVFEPGVPALWEMLGVKS